MKSYTALFISDIHMLNKLPYARIGVDGTSDRMLDQKKLWKRVHRAALEHKVDAIYVLGDLFDKSMVDAVTLTATVAAITGSPCPVYIVPGNHDATSTRGGRFTVEAFGVMGSANVHYLGTELRGLSPAGASWIRFWPMEFCVPEKAREWLAEAKTAPRAKVNVALMHHSILGCTHIGWTCDDGLTPEEVCDGFDWVFTGHFHDHQTFGPEERGMYLGAPMHHRFDDEGRKAGFWVVEFRSNRTIHKTFIDGGAPRFHTTTWPLSKAVRKSKYAPGDYVRIIVEATHAEWAKIKPDVIESVAKMEADGLRASFKHKPVYHHTVRIKPLSKASSKVRPEELVDQYVDAVDVDTTGLDKTLLRRIGREAIEVAARGRVTE